MVEQLICNQQVGGSSPSTSSKNKRTHKTKYTKEVAMSSLKYAIGERLETRHPDKNGKHMPAVVKRIDPNPADGRVYLIKTADGTKTWYYPTHVSTDFRRPKPERAETA